MCILISVDRKLKLNKESENQEMTLANELRAAILAEVTKEAMSLQVEVEGVLDGRFSTAIVTGTVGDPTATVWIVDSKGEYLLPVLSRHTFDSLMTFVKGMQVPGNSELDTQEQECSK